MFNVQNTTTPKWILGVDIGGTTISTLLVDTSLLIYDYLMVTTDVTSPQATLQSIIKVIQETLNRSQVDIKQVAAIGLGIPGQVNPQSGVVNMAVNLNWHDFPAGSLLTEALGVPCFLENDVRLAALGLHHFHHQQTIQNLAYISIGTGIAAGIILREQLYRGTTGMAGEIGHAVVMPDGPRCKCGLNGCLEAIAAGPAIARQAQEAIEAGRETILANSSTITAHDVYLAADVGDEVALKITTQVGIHLGQAIYNLVMTYDVEKIILGGGVTQAGASFLQPILAKLDQLRQQSYVAKTMLTPQLVELVPKDFAPGPWGGIALALQQSGEVIQLPQHNKVSTKNGYGCNQHHANFIMTP